MRQRRGRDHCAVRDAHVVMDSCTASSAREDGDGGLDRRLLDHDRLEARPCSVIPFSMCCAVLVQRRCADRGSPRASIGLSMLLASIVSSAAPAPTTVCSSSMNRMTCPAAPGHFLEHRLEPLLELAAILSVLAMSEPMSSATTRLSFRPSGTSPRCDRPAPPQSRSCRRPAHR